MNFDSAREIVRRATSGETTAEDIARACLDRIAAREDVVQAWTFLDPARVMAEARRLDSAKQRGLLHGLPVAIKDVIDTADMPTSYGSPIYADYRPFADAACVALLREAGALIVGKTVTTEFAATLPGKTRNPRNSKHTPGGSSSGSAAAVADGMVPIALGTQTMGSLIRPAAYCGTVGFKPSFGTINRTGVKPQADSLDTVGVIGRNVDDTALIVEVLVDGKPGVFNQTRTRPPTIGVYRGPDWSKAEAPAIAALDEAASRLSSAGAQVTEIDPPQILRDAYQAQIPLVFYEMSRGMSDEWLRHREKLSQGLQDFTKRGFEQSFSEFLAAEKVAFAARQWMHEAFQSADFWLTLSAPGEAPEGENTGESHFNRLWTLLHLPVITLPVQRGPKNMPLGVQLVGRFRGDAELIASACWVEQCLGFVDA